MKFFFKSPDGLEQGPADLEEMRARIARGSVSVLTMVRVSGSQTWENATDVAELRDFFQPSSEIEPGGIESRELKNLRVEDLPRVGLYLAERMAPWVGLAVCVPIAVFALATLLVLLNTNDNLARTTGRSLFAGPGGLLVPLISLVWLGTVPNGA